MRSLLAALLLLALAPASAGAHAVLRETTPERGAALKAAPATVELRFSEPVEAEFGAVIVRRRRAKSGGPGEGTAEAW